MKRRQTLFALLVLLVVSLVFAAGCASSRLGEYDFDDATLAVIVNQPATPQVETGGWFWVDPGNVIASAARAGAAVAREVSAGRAQERMYRAMERVDVGTLVAERTRDRSAVYLHARPVDATDAADYLLDVWIHDYGIEADSWDAAVYFRMKADVTLIDAATGRRIWKQRVKARDPVTGPTFIDPVVDDILTADALSRLSEDEMVAAFEQLADLTADKFTRELREDLQRARR